MEARPLHHVNRVAVDVDADAAIGQALHLLHVDHEVTTTDAALVGWRGDRAGGAGQRGLVAGAFGTGGFGDRAKWADVVRVRRQKRVVEPRFRAPRELPLGAFFGRCQAVYARAALYACDAEVQVEAPDRHERHFWSVRDQREEQRQAAARQTACDHHRGGVWAFTVDQEVKGPAGREVRLNPAFFFSPVALKPNSQSCATGFARDRVGRTTRTAERFERRWRARREARRGRPQAGRQCQLQFDDGRDDPEVFLTPEFEVPREHRSLPETGSGEFGRELYDGVHRWDQRQRRTVYARCGRHRQRERKDSDRDRYRATEASYE